jgi:cyclic pyranopterin phosphate synthase
LGDFSHLSETGHAAMVDITAKQSTDRAATVTGRVDISAHCVKSLTLDAVKEIIAVARIAGIQAAKQTANLIPLCHQIPLAGVDLTVDYLAADQCFILNATARTHSGTGVEMEAMVAVNLCAITIYDMVKAVDPAAVLSSFRLVEKTGGKGGKWQRNP